MRVPVKTRSKSVRNKTNRGLLTETKSDTHLLKMSESSHILKDASALVSPGTATPNLGQVIVVKYPDLNVKQLNSKRLILLQQSESFKDKKLIFKAR